MGWNESTVQILFDTDIWEAVLGNDEEIFKRRYEPFQIINRLISTLGGDDVKVMLLMDLFSSVLCSLCLFVKVLTGTLAARAEEYI